MVMVVVFFCIVERLINWKKQKSAVLLILYYTFYIIEWSHAFSLGTLPISLPVMKTKLHAFYILLELFWLQELSP